MSTTTTDQGLILPTGTDVNDVPTALSRLITGGSIASPVPASSLESRLFKRYLSVADRSTRNPTPAEGEGGFMMDTNQFVVYNGSAWTIVAGYVMDASDSTSNVGTTTTEVVSSSIQFTAIANVRYKVTYTGCAESSVQYDQALCRLRWKNTNIVDTSGTQFAATPKTAAAASHGDSFVLIGTFNGQSAGTVTVAATIVRNLGTGTVRQNLPGTGQTAYWLVEIV